MTKTDYEDVKLKFSEAEWEEELSRKLSKQGENSFRINIK